MQSKKTRLLEILRQKSVSYGDFTLSSGKTSKYYVDAKRTTHDPEGVSLCGELVFGIIKRLGKKVSTVGGLTLGADPMQTSTIMEAFKHDYYLNGFTVRKEAKTHGKMKLLEGNLDKTDTVVILDDVITTGKSTLQAIDSVEKYGAEIAAVVALVDRLEGGTEAIKERGYEVHSVFTIDELLEKDKLGETNSNGESGQPQSTAGKGIFPKELV